ncbi:unnamed protein product [Lactuca virosa]|uniref:Uncharacterized protein n=1 Tax=Lactuca virosa TaxID=75947 RepID=A0AAU9NTV9_9ASTR|nr:unnamed protein product [Lactuca virosa]
MISLPPSPPTTELQILNRRYLFSVAYPVYRGHLLPPMNILHQIHLRVSSPFPTTGEHLSLDTSPVGSRSVSSPICSCFMLQSPQLTPSAASAYRRLLPYGVVGKIQHQHLVTLPSLTI